MPTQPSPTTDSNVIGADKKSVVVFHNSGQHPLPPSAGVPAAITKGNSGQVTGVHGTTSGIVFDSPA